VGGTDWKGGWHRLERWVAPIGKGFWRLKKKEERRRGMTCAKVSYEEVA
jgi:hypothetical protein